ncbi:InlB B-repeat-containing protein [Candidatus Saccharibacteria bacterium]|nr:InlB B-repeat-containing protein [Candidatus Saccharibacteria bacterium]
MEGNTVYTLTYDANGGEGAPGVAIKNSNENFAIFTAESLTPVRPGFVFSGWSFSPTGEAMIHAGDLFTVTARDTTVYAIWTEALTEDEVISSATEENAEPLGVFSSSDSNDSQVQIVGDAIGFAFIGAAVILGLIALLLFRQRQPRIISKEEEEE